MDDRRRDRPADGRATAIVVGAAALAAVTGALDLANASADVPASAGLQPGWTAVVPGLAIVIPGALLVRLMRRHAVAWILVGFGFLWLLDGLAAAWAIHAIYVEQVPPVGGAPLASAAYWFYARFGATLLLGLPLLLLLFPDGRLPEHRRWRRLSMASLGLTAVLPLVLLFVPSEVIAQYTGTPLAGELAALALDPVSVALPYDVWAALLGLAYGAAAVSLIVPFLVTVHRFRASAGVRRLQMRWLVWAGLIDVFAVLLPLALPSALGGALAGVSLSIAVAVTSASVVVAVTRYRLYEIDRLLSATLVYGMLVVAVVVVDVVVFTLAGSLLGERDAALVALGVVAVLYSPLRARLWSWVRRWLRGSREDPYGTVATLAERLEDAAGLEEQLRTAARSLADAFRLPYVAFELARVEGSPLDVAHGTADGSEVSLPVMYRGVEVGRLALSLRVQSALSERDQRLLGDLARQAVVAARAGELSEVLQQHREQLVGAREEERRRIRRDLHDSLGPTLAAVSLRIETARNLAASDSAAADRLLAQTADQVRDVLAEVRRIAHDLRPPALDELGLLRALQQQGEALSGDGLQVAVSGLGPMDGLPAAVEVAAYRIASEGLANVRRHARATVCDVTLTRMDHADGSAELLVEVQDDGVGPHARQALPGTPGLGTLSILERAAELGGRARITAAPSGTGTIVTARLPIVAVEVSVDA